MSRIFIDSENNLVSILICDEDTIYFKDDSSMISRTGDYFVPSSIVAKGDFEVVMMKSTENGKQH